MRGINRTGAMLRVLVVSWAFALTTAISCMAFAYEESLSSFSIEVKGVESNLELLSITAMPGENIHIKTASHAEAQSGVLQAGKSGWRWIAPGHAGIYKIVFSDGEQRSTLNVFVLTPWRKNESTELNGFRIGVYNETPFRGLATYAAPEGFIEAGASLIDTRISPHFTLGQFRSKQQPDHEPTYLLINPGTLVKLERLLSLANARGWPIETFNVMSGFRTPYYNKLIGNRTTSSRHLYGGGADIFIDVDGDNWMDDLNGDQIADKRDAIVLANLAETIAKSDKKSWPAGGLSAYPGNSVHGPFVHIDSRGYTARWGK